DFGCANGRTPARVAERTSGISSLWPWDNAGASYPGRYRHLRGKGYCPPRPSAHSASARGLGCDAGRVFPALAYIWPRYGLVRNGGTDPPRRLQTDRARRLPVFWRCEWPQRGGSGLAEWPSAWKDP